MVFLKALLIILLVYYLLKIFGRWLAPRLFSYASRKAEDHIRRQFDTFQNAGGEAEKPIGEVTIDKKPTRKNNSSKDIGEYIEFEELE